VLDTLQFLPTYTRNFPDFKDRKRTVIFDFWTRSTIRWSLECDVQDGKSRKEVYELFRNTIDTDDWSNASLKGFVITVIATTVFFCIGGTICGGAVVFDKGAVGITACIAVLQVLMLTGFTICVLYFAGEATV